MIMIMLSPFQIVQVALVSVRFLFKSYMVVGLIPIPIFDKEYQPFQPVPYKERKVEQFTLLLYVNHFMVQVILVKWSYSKNELRKRDGQEILAKRMLLDV